MSDVGGNGDVKIGINLDIPDSAFQRLAELNRAVAGLGGSGAADFGAPAIPSFAGDSSAPAGASPSPPNPWMNVPPGATPGNPFGGGYGQGGLGAASVAGVLSDISTTLRSIHQLLAGGGAAAMGTTGGGGVGVTGGSGGGGTFPINPHVGGGGGEGGGISWGRFGGNVRQSGSIAGIYAAAGMEVEAGLAAAGVNPGAMLGIGAAGAVIGQAWNTYANASYGSQAPSFQVETDLMSARASGQYIPEATQQTMQAIARRRGAANSLRDWMNTVSFFPGITPWIRENFDQPLDRADALDTAINAGQLKQNDVLFMARASGARHLYGQDALPYEIGVIGALAGYGSAAAANATGPLKELRDIAAKATLSDGSMQIAGYNSIVGVASDPAMIGFRRGITSGADPLGGMHQAYEYYANRGMRGQVQSVMGADSDLSGGRSDFWLNRVSQIQDLQGASSIAGLQQGVFGQRASNVLAGGAGGVNDVARALDSELGPANTRMNSAHELLRMVRNSGDPAIVAQRESELAQAEGGVIAARRAHGNFAFGFQGSEIGLAGSQAGTASARAGLFGSPGDIRSAGMGQADVLQQQVDLLQKRVNGGFGHLGPQEELQAQTQLNDAMREHFQLLQQVQRGYYQTNIQMAGIGQGMAGAMASRAGMQGIGGAAGVGIGYGQVTAAQESAKQAHAYLDYLVGQGVDANNPERRQAELAATQADNAVMQSGIGLAGSNHVSIGLQRQESSLGYSASILSSLPGTYGSLRGVNLAQMHNAQQEATEIMAARDRQRALSGGHLSEMEEFQYQQQLQSVGQAQLGAYANLSFGWEGRLMSQVINAPGSFSMISPFASARAAVGAGVMNPHLGSRLSSNDFFLRQAGLMSSIAGSTGTPEGFAMTALTGAHPRNPHMLGLEGGDSGMRSDLKGAIDGATIIIEMRMADGSVQRQRGTLRSPNNHVAGSSVSISESASRGGWVGGNVDR